MTLTIPPNITPYQLPDEYVQLRAAARKVCESEIAPQAATTDRTGQFPVACYEALRSCDLHAPRVAEEYGGAGADALATAIIVEEVARTCAASALIPAINSLGTLILQAAASPWIKETYLPPIARGETMISFCLTESEAGSDAAAIAARAEPIDGGYRINGIKRWVTHAGVSSLYIVFAVTDRSAGSRGVSAFLVEKNDPGLSFGRLEQKMGLKGSPTRDVQLDDVWVPATRMIGTPGSGFRTALSALAQTRIVIAAQALGIAQGALEYATGYVKERKQFGKTLSKFQGVQFMLAEMAIRVESARQLIYAAAGRAQQVDPVDLPLLSSAAKTLASDTAVSVTTDAVQLLGSYGYSCDYPVERMMRDAKVTQIYGGTNQIQRLIIARALLGPDHG